MVKYILLLIAVDSVLIVMFVTTIVIFLIFSFGQKKKLDFSEIEQCLVLLQIIYKFDLLFLPLF